MAFTNMSVTDTYDALLSTTLRNYRKKLEDNPNAVLLSS